MYEDRHYAHRAQRRRRSLNGETIGTGYYLPDSSVEARVAHCLQPEKYGWTTLSRKAEELKKLSDSESSEEVVRSFDIANADIIAAHVIAANEIVPNLQIEGLY